MSAERDAFIKGLEAAILGVRTYEKAAKQNLRRHRLRGVTSTKRDFESGIQFWTSRAVCAHEIADGLQEHIDRLKKGKK